MEQIGPLSSDLVEKYHAWKATGYADNRAEFHRLVDEGQTPSGMVISCCDSRVQPEHMFGAAAGTFFVHRNIANFVPPYDPGGDGLGTSAAIEYGVTALKVPRIIVIGHSQCGGVAGCHAMCNGEAPQLEAPSSAVGRWVGMLKPAFAKVDSGTPKEHQLQAFEQQSVIQSLENLMAYPYVAEAVRDQRLALHGLWIDIRDGALRQFSTETGTFDAI